MYKCGCLCIKSHLQKQILGWIWPVGYSLPIFELKVERLVKWQLQYFRPLAWARFVIEGITIKYIYIYICVCVCVCVYIYIYIYKKWQPTPVFLPGEFHWQRSLAGYSPNGHRESYMTEWLIFSLLCIWSKILNGYSCLDTLGKKSIFSSWKESNNWG